MAYDRSNNIDNRIIALTVDLNSEVYMFQNIASYTPSVFFL